MVEIAKAFRSELSVLILDEPTASLTERETRRLFTLIEQAKREGVGIVYITHRMNEIKRIGDRITVLRDGRKVATLNVAEVTEMRLVELMTGRVIAQIFPKIANRPGATILEVKGLTTATGNVSNVSIRPCEAANRRARGIRGFRQIRSGARLLRRRTDRRRRCHLRRRGRQGHDAAPNARPGLLLSATGPPR